MSLRHLNTLTWSKEALWFPPPLPAHTVQPVALIASLLCDWQRVVTIWAAGGLTTPEAVWGKFQAPSISRPILKERSVLGANLWGGKPVGSCVRCALACEQGVWLPPPTGPKHIV